MKMSRRALRKRTCRAGGKKRTLRNRTCRSKVRRGGYRREPDKAMRDMFDEMRKRLVNI